MSEEKIIVKVQMSVYPVGQVMVYNQNRSMTFIGNATEEIKKIMGKTLKNFFYATYNEAKQFELISEAPWQKW